ncbi:MAG TPA: thiamine pyrophosphate-binding protein, partial [Planctomycetia bacterium]|nr:thiamine pyrophosphate-binding protein [Planctomycetia bacterium]
MDGRATRRQFLQAGLAPGAAAGALLAEDGAEAAPAAAARRMLSGAQALVETLQAHGCRCVYGIPGAQANELWDVFKQLNLPYLLATHEFSATAMADGYARSTGETGVLCVVPGPGVTNSLTGLGEARLDSTPLVCIIADLAEGEHYRPFQIHSIPNAELLRPIVKTVIKVEDSAQIPGAVAQAFAAARDGEPGPVALLVSYPLLVERKRHAICGAWAAPSPYDAAAVERAICLLSDRRLGVGLHVGLGCMDLGPRLVELAEMLQAPVSTSVSGKGSLPENHPLSVGWGYGPQGSAVAEHVFKKHVDLVLAVGVKFSEMTTG